MDKVNGRPTQYRLNYNNTVYKLCLLGATDKEIASILDISEATLYKWKLKHPKFVEAIKEGKEKADAEIANKLYHRAKGYSHPDVHISNYMGDITITPLTKHYPPDPTSMIFWLKNRQPRLWRDKQEIDQKINVDLTVVEVITKAQVDDDDIGYVEN